MIIDCVSDLHGFYPRLEGGDLLIVAGDLTRNDKIASWLKFYKWLESQKHKRIVYIAGNHDNFLTYGLSSSERKDLFEEGHGRIEYLCDSGTEFEGFKIWGSPWTPAFPGINPKCMAFTGTEEELAAKFALIPHDIDILITHGPPYCLQDHRPPTPREKLGNIRSCFGSKSLHDRIGEIDDEGCGKYRLLVCGHIHEGAGSLRVNNMIHDKLTWHIVNCSHVNEHYKPVNPPIRVIL